MGGNVSEESAHPQKVLDGKQLAEASAVPAGNEGDLRKDRKLKMTIKVGEDGAGPRKNRGGRSRKPLQKMVIDSDDDEGESAGESGSEYEMSEEEESEEDLEMDDVAASDTDSGEEEYGELDESNKSTEKKPAKSTHGGKDHAETPNVAVNNKVQITPSSYTTPGSVSKRLREVLDSSTPGSGTELGVESPAGLLHSASRFLQRESSRFPFLQADRIRDAQRRRPDDPEYVHNSVGINKL